MISESAYQVLVTHIEKKVQLEAPDKMRVKDYFVQKRIKRRQYALQEGDVCKVLTFVSSGLLKSFNEDEKGNERISLFASEGWWISDFNSFIHQEPAVLNIDALEDSELLLLHRENYERLMS